MMVSKPALTAPLSTRLLHSTEEGDKPGDGDMPGIHGRPLSRDTYAGIFFVDLRIPDQDRDRRVSPKDIALQ